jgi:spore maturation protein CgeB
MRIVLFCHSILSDWNHGNAHFLRGITSELQRRGHVVRVFEPENGWSLSNLLADAGEAGVAPFREAYPELDSTFYDPVNLDLDTALDGADLVVAHEWSDPLLIERLAAHRRRGGRYRLLFHDTHHRSATDPAAMARYNLDGFDGVLAFGEAVRSIYLAQGWARCVWTWHEAADAARFRPFEVERTGDLVWIGNWGDGERSRELHEFLLEPVTVLRLAATVHGVRYPPEGRDALAKAGIVYGGYLPNPLAPAAFAYHRVTVHVPRRPYAKALPGIPTIRVFEALACGIPLISAPWDDREGLFSPGEDFLVARDGNEMRHHLRFLLNEPDAAAARAAHGRETILARHTSHHRVNELLEICRSLGVGDADAEESEVCVSG